MLSSLVYLPLESKGIKTKQSSDKIYETHTADHVEKGIRMFVFLRGFVSIYTISIGIYLTFKAAEKLNLPEWSGNYFPW